MKNYYQVLGIAVDSDFSTVKKSYYRRAKECHPDRHDNSRAKEEEFKLVVEAFDILSDPLKRSQFDRLISQTDTASNLLAVELQSDAVMDTGADDTLEELITGNAIPLDTSLATLFLDLTRTEVFIDFREGKNLFYHKRYRAARNFFLRAIEHSPGNIVYRAFMARVSARLGDYSRARKEYRQALDLGQRRSPPQELRRLRRELDDILKNHSSWWFRIFGLFSPSRHDLSDDATTGMIDETNRALARLSDSRRRKNSHDTTKLLNK